MRQKAVSDPAALCSFRKQQPPRTVNQERASSCIMRIVCLSPNSFNSYPTPVTVSDKEPVHCRHVWKDQEESLSEFSWPSWERPQTNCSLQLVLETESQRAPHHSSMAAVCNHTAMNAVNMVPSMTRDNPTEFGGRDIKQQSYCGTLGFLTYPRGSLGIYQEKFPQRQCGRTECDQETGELSSYFDS